MSFFVVQWIEEGEENQISTVSGKDVLGEARVDQVVSVILRVKGQLKSYQAKILQVFGE